LYKENSFFFHLKRNWSTLISSPAQEFVGLMQYDMILSPAMVEGLSTGALLDVNTVYVCFWKESDDLLQPFIMTP